MAPSPFARISRRGLGPPRINSPPLSCQPMQGQGAQMRPAASSPLALPGVGSPPWGVKMSRPRRGWRIPLGLSPRYSASRAIHPKRLQRSRRLIFWRNSAKIFIIRAAAHPPPPTPPHRGGSPQPPDGGLIPAYTAPCLWLWCYRVLPVGFSGPRGLSLPGSRPALPRGCGQ